MLPKTAYGVCSVGHVGFYIASLRSFGGGFVFQAPLMWPNTAGLAQCSHTYEVPQYPCAVPMGKPLLCFARGN